MKQRAPDDDLGTVSSVSDSKRLKVLVALMIGLAVSVASISSWNIYHTSIKAQRNWLMISVQEVGMTIDAMMSHLDAMPPSLEVKSETVLAQLLIDINFNKTGFGQTGEFVVGERKGDEISFLLPNRYGQGKRPDQVPFESVSAAPMRHALSGHSGSIVGLDYRDEMVLAAFVPLKGGKRGLVAKINLSEIQKPLIQSALQSAAITMLLTVLGVWCTWRLTSPLLVRLDKRAKDLEIMAKDLSRSNNDLEQFAYIASHDLKAPLRGISNLIDWLAEDLDGNLDEQNERHMGLLKGRAERLEKMLSGLLSYCRVGRTKCNEEDINVAELLNDIVELLSAPAGFHVNIDPSMPIIQSPRAPLDLVFRNLIGNAIKHYNSDHGEIRVGYKDLGSVHEFTIADKGPGIPRKFHERMFSVFQTLRPRDEVEASGMGLALVKKTLLYYGCEITVISDPSSQPGTVFKFTWPKLFAGVYL